MSKTSVRIFAVEGEGEFPFEMLATDQCWPRADIDAAEVRKRPQCEDTNPLYRQVRLATRSRSAPDRKAWRACNWSVVD